MENDPEVGVKKKAVFALSQLPKDEAVPELLHVAQTNASPTVRKDAIFWLGQTTTREPSRTSNRYSDTNKRSSAMAPRAGEPPVGLHVVSANHRCYASHEGSRVKFSCSRPLERARLQTIFRRGSVHWDISRCWPEHTYF